MFPAGALSGINMKFKDIQKRLQKHKTAILAVLAVIALLGFIILFEYIGGKIIYAVYDIDKEPSWNTAWHYLQRYGSSHNKRLKLLVWFAALLPLIVLTAAGTAIALSQKKRALYGDARFANMGEIRKAGLLPDKDHRDETILVGKFKGQYLRYGGYQFVMLAAPTRSGKGVGIVIPNCLTYTGSLVVLDIKLENFDITAGFRQAPKEKGGLGQEIYLFAPFDANGRTHRWNPISYISEDPSNRMGDIDAIANALYNNPNAKDPFWDNMAKDMFRACCLAVIETPENLKPHTLGQIIREASAGIDNLKFLLDARVKMVKDDDGKLVEDRSAGPQAAEEKKEQPARRHVIGASAPKEGQEDGKKGEDTRPYYYSDACRRAIKRMTDMPEQTFGSVKSSFQSPLLAFENPRVDAATSANDFDIRDVRKKRMTIYLGITPDKLAEASVIVNLFFDQLLSQNTKVLPKQDPEHLKYQCLMILDEFTAIGKVNMIAKSISYQAGYNMRVLTIIQNKSQLEDVYGKSGAVTLMSNHALMIMYAPSPVVQSDAKEYSEMLGDTTVKSTSKSRSYSKQSSHSDSISDQKRALMLPQEIKEIGRWREIVSLENCKPIFCDKIKYFEDPDFTGKINWPLIDDEEHRIPVIDVNDFLAELQGRLRPVTAADKDPNKLAGAKHIPVTMPTAEDRDKAQSLFNDLFKPDGTLTQKGEQHVADDISAQIIRDKNGNAIGKEGVKKLTMAGARMNNPEQYRKMTEGLKHSGESAETTVAVPDIPASEPAEAEQEHPAVSQTGAVQDQQKGSAAISMPDASELANANSMFDDDFVSNPSPAAEEQPVPKDQETSDDDDFSKFFGSQEKVKSEDSIPDTDREFRDIRDIVRDNKVTQADQRNGQSESGEHDNEEHND